MSLGRELIGEMIKTPPKRIVMFPARIVHYLDGLVHLEDGTTWRLYKRGGKYFRRRLRRAA